MLFKLIDRHDRAEETSVVYLRDTSWDDWFKFSTTFDVFYVNGSGHTVTLGATKIGRFGLRPGRNSPNLDDITRHPRPPSSFETLPEDFFSLGQDTSYYESLSDIGASFREEYLASMRDIAFDSSLLERAKNEEVTRVSLLRTVPLLTVEEQFSRLARGGSRLTTFNFKFNLKYTKTDPVPTVRFAVKPNSLPPTNVHVLVGRNGVGKSTFLHNLATHLVGRERTNERESAISNLVSVSFSAFDAFEPISTPHDRLSSLTYHYVGLKKRHTKKSNPGAIKSLASLAREMQDSARVCFEGARRARWVRGLRLLESDQIFASAEIADVTEAATSVDDVLSHIATVFRRLSSGHKIVLLTVTKLVETVEEKSLVLIDEPEAHLHPPLLSAFISSLTDLLKNRNGVAVVATHSPVVLQEVPRTCVWKINRIGDRTSLQRPRIETFGENAGTLIDEIFGLEVTATGFHRLLREVALEYRDYESALSAFDGQLGAEGKAILRSMIMNMEDGANVAS
jgi:predicted ATPase